MSVHQPVLLNQVIEQLAIEPDGIYVDATYGRGGHAATILDRLGQKGQLHVFDRDPDAIAAAQSTWAHDARVVVHHHTFSKLLTVIRQAGQEGQVGGILMDLGVSSPQLDQAERGFSFMHAGPLDMRMDPTTGISAAEWINETSLDELTKVIREYGQERYARRIARSIVNARHRALLKTTTQLAQIVQAAIPKWQADKHPATRTFQAIRIFINDELNQLKDALEQSLSVLKVGGRLLVICFHSLEDQWVRRFIQKNERDPRWPNGVPVEAAQIRPRLKRVHSGFRADEYEKASNVRSRSAVLRVMEKLR